MPYFPPPSSGGSFLPLAGGTMTGTITSTIGTITASTPALSATQTWNSSGTTFYGILLTVTNTAQASGSRLIELRSGAAVRFSVDKDGYQVTSGGNFSDAWNGPNTRIRLDNGGFRVGTSASFLFASGSDAGGTIDTGLYRNAAGVVEVNNGTAGTFRDIKVRSIIIDGAPSTSGAGQIAIGADTRTTIGANGGASALTALPVGYIDIDIAGSSYQIPYYNRGA